MKETGINPKTQTYNILLKLSIRESNRKNVETIEEIMKVNNIEKTVVTYTLLFQFYAKKDPNMAIQLLKEMHSKEIKPDEMMKNQIEFFANRSPTLMKRLEELQRTLKHKFIDHKP